MTSSSIRRALFALGGGAALAALGAAPLEADRPSNPPFKMVQTHAIIFPIRMIHEGVLYGETRIVFHVDREGRLVDALAVAYTAKPFADAALDALLRWKFIPQRVDGRTGSSVVHLSVRFEINGLVAIERLQPPSTEVKPDLPAGTFMYQPCAPGALDRPLRPTTVVPPDYPGDMRRQGIGGVVPVNFYVDEQGRTRMVVSAPDADPILANLAIAAVEKWRFEPPKSRGQPVLVHASQEFRFEAADKPGGAARK